jgi:hypothetical protein
MTTIHRWAAVIAVTACGAVLTGCSSDKTAKTVGSMNTSNIQRLANIYAAFQNYKSGRGPNDEAEFKTFIKEYDPEKLKMMGIDGNNVDAVFTSERDGQPLKVRYKVGGGRGSVDAVVFESAGKDGTKQVGYTGGKVDDVDEATYQQLWAGKGPSVQAAGGPAPAGQPGEKGGKGRPTGAPAGAPTGPPGK